LVQVEMLALILQVVQEHKVEIQVFQLLHLQVVDMEPVVMLEVLLAELVVVVVVAAEQPVVLVVLLL
jgi:hypothetical protein